MKRDMIVASQSAIETSGSSGEMQHLLRAEGVLEYLRRRRERVV